MDWQPTFLVLTYPQRNELWPYYQKDVNQITLNHTTLSNFPFSNIQGLRSNFFECESFLESNSTDILALCETNLNDSIDSNHSSVRGYLPFIRKDSSTHIHGLTVHVNEGFPFAWDLSLENSADSCFRLAFLHSVSYFFFIYRSAFSSLCTVFDSVSSNIDEVISINLSAMFFSGDFNANHKDWLAYSNGTDRPGEICYNFSISNNFTSQKLGSRDFWRIANSVLNETKSAILLLFNDQEVLSSASDKVVYCIWNYLPMKCFPFTYDLSGFKSRINRHVLTIASF